MVYSQQQYVHDELLVFIKACDESDVYIPGFLIMIFGLIEQAAVISVGHYVVLFVVCIYPALQVILNAFRYCDDGIKLIYMFFKVVQPYAMICFNQGYIVFFRVIEGGIF